MRPSVQLVDNYNNSCENIGFSLYPSSMITFNLPTPMSHINSSHIFAISPIGNNHVSLETSFKKTYISDPWTLPNPNALEKGD